MENREELIWERQALKYLKIIRTDFEWATAKTVEECLISVVCGKLHFSWIDQPNTFWLIFSIHGIPTNESYRTLYSRLKECLSLPKLPWGALQGVRPTKLVNQLLEQKYSPYEVVELLINQYDVDRERAILIKDIALNQKKMIINTEGSVGVYIGIPFCPSRCYYCSFPGEVVPGQISEIEDFFLFLAQDIYDTAHWIRKYSKKISTVYIGGGTPTTLPIHLLERLFVLIQKEFDLTHLKEYSFEAGRPETMSEEKLKLALDYGVTRVSVNPQTMNLGTLEKIGRTHQVSDIYKAVNMVRQVGFQILNMDLIAGLPEESPKEFLYSLDQVLQLKPENITVHSLALKKGSSWLENIGQLPKGEDIKIMVEKAREMLKNNEYSPYYLYRQQKSPGKFENIGYALPGTESLYNIQMMEETHSVVGIGPGSATKKMLNHGTINRYYFPKDRRTYQDNLEDYLNLRREVLNSN